MNLTNIQDRVRAVIRDSAKAFIPDSEITNWANDANLDLASRLEVVRLETSATIPASQKVPLASTFLRAVFLRLGTDDVEFVNDDVFHSWKDSGDTPDHTLGRVHGTDIELYPLPAVAKAYTLRFIGTPAALSVGGDVPETPVDVHVKIVYYAQAQAKYKSGELAEGDRYMVAYEEGLPPSPTGKKRFVPGPLAMSIYPGPFDYEDARHF